MSYANPTPLRIGMAGTLFGQQFRVVGRVVMGMEEEGETYYWNEFNIVNPQNQFGTLVYEQTESGPQWRLFTLIEPQFPLTAREAATKQVGDVVNLEGTPLPVTLVDESRVYHIEGEAPEGVDLGDVAHYFNAEAGDQMLVASWTGEDIEFYQGVDLARGLVAAAFSLPAETATSFLDSTAGGAPAAASVRRLVIFFLLIVMAMVAFSTFRPGCSSSVALRLKTAPAAPLTIHSTGKLDGRSWQIRTHTVVEIDQVGLAFERHEYGLTNDDGSRALLVCGLKPDAADWVLFTPLDPTVPMTPYAAAAVRFGDTVDVNGTVETVTDLFQTTVRGVEPAESSAVKTGDRFYGFCARSGSTLLLAQWNESEIAFYTGTLLPRKTVTSAFRPIPK